MDASFYGPRQRDGKIVAFADVDVAGGVIVRGFRVIRGKRGLFASVPSRSFKVEGETRYYHQVAFATNEIRERFLAALLEAYAQWERAQKGDAEAQPVTSASE